MLEGLKVIEYATYMAAPGAGCILSDWGAEVIIVDTTTPEGQEIVRKLASDADVFLTNVRPGGLTRSGMDHESLRALNPKLVYCSLTGYGLEGPDADRPGFDIASFWSRTGVARLTIPKGEDPYALRTAFGDHTTSMSAAAGICAALVEAQRTGKGRLVEASLFRTGLYAMGSDFAIQLFFGRIASTKGRTEQIVPISNFYQTKDGHWICTVARQGDVDWVPMCKVIDREDLAEDPRFTTSKARRQNMGEVIALIDEGFAKYTKAEISERLDANSIAWAPVQTLGEVAEDPQAFASGAIVQTPSSKGDGSTYASPASPVRFPGADDGPKGPSPRMGQHTREVLAGLGIAEAEIDALLKSSVVA